MHAWSPPVDRFSEFTRERRYLHTVSAASLTWYKHAFKWPPSQTPTQNELKNIVVQVREKGLKETGCHHPICLNRESRKTSCLLFQKSRSRAWQRLRRRYSNRHHDGSRGAFRIGRRRACRDILLRGRHRESSRFQRERSSHMEHIERPQSSHPCPRKRSRTCDQS
jgi:hypothetical protein